jgi:putative addiction module component (TIGR02574 family)
MATPKFDFSHLSPAERLTLIEELWDSIEPTEAVPLSPELVEELEARSAQAEADPTGGRPWDEVYRELKKRLE